MSAWTPPPRKVPGLLCRTGFHRWSLWEYGRHTRFTECYERRCVRKGCWTLQQASILDLLKEDPALFKPVEPDKDDD